MTPQGYYWLYRISRFQAKLVIGSAEGNAVDPRLTLLFFDQICSILGSLFQGFYCIWWYYRFHSMDWKHCSYIANPQSIYD